MCVFGTTDIIFLEMNIKINMHQTERWLNLDCESNIGIYNLPLLTHITDTNNKGGKLET